MKIQTKLMLGFLIIGLVPMLIIVMVSIYNAKGAIEAARIDQLEVVADLKADKISGFIYERKANIEAAQDSFNIKSNLPIVTQFANNRQHSDYIAAEKALNDQFKAFLDVYSFVYVDLMLVNSEGTIVYVANEAHQSKDLSSSLPDPDGKAFEEGKKGVFFSKISHNNVAEIPFSMLVTAPILDFQDRFIGVLALEVNMDSIYRIIQDTTGLGMTGETLVGENTDEEVLFLNPLRHATEANFKQKIALEGEDASPLQDAVRGLEGTDIRSDYRGERVIAAWRHIPVLDWGMVAKIDTDEAFSDVRLLEYYIALIGGILILILGFVSTTLSKSIFKPIEVLQQGVSKVIIGDLNHQVTVHADDEIGALAGHFNVMVDKLKARNKDLSDFKYALDETAIVSITDVQGVIGYVNDRFCKVSGFSREEMIGKTHRVINSGSHSKDFFKEMWSTIKSGKIWHGHIKNKSKDGSFYWMDMRIIPFLDDQGKPYQFLASRTDITQRRAIEDKIRVLAHYDELTRLPNRSLFNERLEQTLQQRSWGKRPFAVMFLDLDRFKLINDTLGHSAGDFLLQQVAGRLTGCLRIEDTVARIGGDEFTILLTAIAKSEDAFFIAQKIVKSLKKPFMIEGQELIATGSIGVSTYPDNGEDSETLLRNADSAMYLAKKNGRGRFNIYKPEIKTRSTNKLKMVSDLSHAIDRGEFRLHYQALVDLKSGKIVGVEALIRWEREGEDLISPSDFIPLAEEYGLIVQIGQWVLRTAALQLKSWQNAGYHDLTLSMNVAAPQFQEFDFIDRLNLVIEETRIEPERLKLELTESLLMKSDDGAILRLNEIKALGVRLAIDDFGTGYSSLSYLKRFPVDTLKIDQSFVSNIPENHDDSAIAEMIISLATQLNLDVVAEGIETKEQLIFLQSRGCQVGQGYLFSKALPAEAFTVLLKETAGRTIFNHDLLEDLKPMKRSEI